MKFLFKFLYLTLIFALGSCALLNKNWVLLTIDSKPNGAKIYIDDNYYGKTTAEIKVSPMQDRILRIEKEGYHSEERILKTKISLRKNRRYLDNKRCNFDALLTPLLLTIFSVTSVNCKDFEREVYVVELVEDAEQKQEEYVPSNSNDLPNNDPLARYYYDYRGQIPVRENHSSSVRRADQQPKNNPNIYFNFDRYLNYQYIDDLNK